MSLPFVQIAVRIFRTLEGLDHQNPENKPEFEENIVGSGILISPNLILTCAHVVESACQHLGRFSKHQIGNIEIFLDFIGDDKIYHARIDLNHWYPAIAQTQTGKLDDVALLNLEQPVKNYNNRQKCCDWTENEYIGKKFYSQGFSNEIGQWVEGECKGPTKHNFIELNPEETITEGHSGGPVCCAQSGDLVGMIVQSEINKPDKKRNRAYMMPVSYLRAVLPAVLFDKNININQVKSINYNHSITSPKFAKQLAGILDRVEHIKSIEYTIRQSASHYHCFMFEFVDDDMPNCFGQQLQLHLYLQDFRPDGGGFAKKYESIRLSLAVEKETFEEQLIFKQKDFFELLKSDIKRIVISTSISLNSGAESYVASIIEFLNKLKQSHPNKCVIVLIGCIRKKKSLLSRWGNNRRQNAAFKTLLSIGASELKPLPEIGAADLINWLGYLPVNVSRLFDQDRLNISFDKILPNDETKRYRQIYEQVQECLLQNLK